MNIFSLKMAGIFSEFLLVSVSHETKHEESSKNPGKIRANSGQNSGQKIEKFGELLFCNFSDLTNRLLIGLPSLAESHGGFLFNIQGPNFNTKN